ncbi:unnamed protein product [Phaedon cochleariae]|uniref:Uncharacterized protein n=1 Tax=Phaedon cochleariae TaxID=80249 RepID=A0A9N9X0F2_PHACE|nr:unnamed protein product [Phaedon cochleariae]
MCCEPEPSIDQLFFDAMDNLSHENKVMDINLFKYILKRKDKLIKELYDKFDLMSEQITLLKERNEDRPKTVRKNNGAKNDDIVDDKRDIIPGKVSPVPMSEGAKYSAVASSSQKSAITKTDVAAALMQINTEQACKEIMNLERNSHPSEIQNQNEWKDVKRKRHRKHIIIGRNDEIKINGKEIRGVPKFADIHIYRVDPRMTAEELKEIVKTRFPEVVVTALNSKHPHLYSSFKVSLYNYNYQNAIDPTIWPHGAHIQRFFQLKPRNAPHGDKTDDTRNKYENIFLYPRPSQLISKP